jgi:hypothetical protein
MSISDLLQPNVYDIFCNEITANVENIATLNVTTLNATNANISGTLTAGTVTAGTITNVGYGSLNPTFTAINNVQGLVNYNANNNYYYNIYGIVMVYVNFIFITPATFMAPNTVEVQMAVPTVTTFHDTFNSVGSGVVAQELADPTISASGVVVTNPGTDIVRFLIPTSGLAVSTPYYASFSFMYPQAGI